MKSFREYTEEHILEFDYPEEKPFAYNLWVGKGAQPSIHQVRTRVARTAGGDPMIFTSHSNDKKKNPLPHKVKVKYLRKFFGKKIGVPDVSARTVFDIATALYNQGYRDIYMVVG